MPYESTGDFLLNATPEEIQKMTEIFKMIKPYDPSTDTRDAEFYKNISTICSNWCRIFNVN